MIVPWRTVLASLGFTVLIPGTATVLIPILLLSVTPRTAQDQSGPLALVGLAVLMAGVLTYAWTALSFSVRGRGTPLPAAPPRALVVSGLYRYVRNPMYLGVLTVLVGEAVGLGSWAILLYAAVLFVAFHFFVVYYEEPTLARTFGESYENYRRSVPRWVPRRQAFGPPERDGRDT